MKLKTHKFLKLNIIHVIKTLLTIIGITLLLNSCSSVEKHNLQVTKLHPVADLHEDIDKVYKQLKRNHPHLYEFTNKEDLDFMFDSLKIAINTPMDSRTFYKQLSAVTKYVGQGHMSLSPPDKKYYKKERKKLKLMRFDINYLDFEYLENKLFITNALGKDSVLINAEVLKIEDETPQNLIKKYKRIIASDGYNTTFHNRIVGSRFMRYYWNDKGRFDSISLTLKNLDSTFVKKYKRVANRDKAKIKKDSIRRDSLKNTPKIKLTKAERKANKTKAKELREYNSKYGKMHIKFMPKVKKYTRNLNFVGRDSTVALVKIRGFTNGRYKGFYDDTFATLDSLKTKTLIIDLRNNFGGRLNEINYLYSYLTDQNYTFINKSETNTRFPFLKGIMSNTNSIGSKFFSGIIAPIAGIVQLLKTSKKDGKLYYKLNSAKEQEPKQLNFKGEIYVLINGNSFSASSILSTQLQGSKRATFVGEETGGAYNGTVAGVMKIYELPNTKVRARIGLLHIDSKYKTDVVGYGVKPDVELIPSYQDRLNNYDPELEWVLKNIK